MSSSAFIGNILSQRWMAFLADVGILLGVLVFALQDVDCISYLFIVTESLLEQRCRTAGTL